MGKLVTIATKARFDALREASKISETSLNFILETGLLYTHNIFINGTSFGTETSNYIPVKIGGVTKNLSLDGHTHSNYYDNSSDIDIGSNKIKSGTLELLKYSSDTLILGNSSIPTEFYGTLKTTKDGTKYTILDTNNFSIVNKTSTNITLNNVALFKYGSSSFQLDYVRRYNTVETFNNLTKYTSAGTTNENSKAYGFITLSTDTGTNSYSYALIRVNIPDNILEFRTSSDTTWKGTLLGGVYRNITINGTTYSIVTKAGSLPTILAPTALGTAGQYLTTSDDGKSLVWRTLPADNNSWRPIAVNGTEKRSSSTSSGNLDIINGTNTTVEWTSGNKLKINSVNTWTAWKGATESANGTAGYMPAPTSALRGQFLRGDGTWVSLNNYSLPTASSSTLGGVKTGVAITDTTGYTAVAIKDGIIYYKDTNTTYTFYNLLFQNSGGTTVDTYKPTTSPTKTLKAGANVTISAASNVITIASTNTWNANAVGVAGYVAAPTKAANANMTWLTDAEGVPAWRASNNHTHSYLPLSGGTLNSGSMIVWRDWGQWEAENPTYPKANGGLQWSGTSDTIKLFAEETASDDLRLVLLFGDDATPRFEIRDRNGNANAYITNGGAANFTALTVNNTAVSLNGHKHAYTDLTGSSTTANQAIVSNGTANGWTLKTLGSRAFDSTSYLPLSGGTMTGIETISSTSAISFANRTSSGTRASHYTSGNYIHGGEDHADQDGANIQIGTWYGFGIYPTISGQTRTQGKNSFWHNARTGNTYTWGEFYSYDGSTNRKVLHEGNSSVSLNGSTLSVKINGITQSLTNTWRGMLNNLTTSNSSTSDSLSAYLGYLLANGSARDNTKLPLSGGTLSGTLSFSNNIGISGIMGGGSDGWGIIGTGESDQGRLKIYVTDNGTSDWLDFEFRDWSGTTYTPLSMTGNQIIFNYNPTVNGHSLIHTGNLPAYPTKASWNYDDRYVSNVALSGNYLRITKNGTNTDLTIPYATSASLASTASRLETYTETSDNTNVYRVIGQQTLNGGWVNKGLVLAVASRHSGVGIYTIHYGAEISNGYYAANNLSNTDSYYTFANVYCKIRYFGDTHDTNLTKIICHVKPASGDKPTSAVFTFFLHSYDYSTPRISILQDWNTPFTLVTNGATMSTIDTSVYGELKESTVMNESNSCTGNAATATKLQTPRTLWGQSFDGSTNISGNMTGVGSITASGDNIITKNSTDQTRFAVKNNNGQVELLTGAARGVYDRTNDTWIVATNGTNTFLQRGNVGIGTTSPSYKLHVNGTSYLGGETTVHGNLNVGASSTSNYIQFFGLTGDNPAQASAHYYIGNRHWADGESSEMLIFSGNDMGNGNSATTLSGAGPDRFRVIAAAHLFLTYTSALSGSFESVATSSVLKDIFEINTNNIKSHVPFISTVTTGTAPILVSSTTLNTNLNADLLDGYHESSFLRYRAATNVNGEATLWSQLGLKQYNGALPESLSGIYNWGQVVSFATQDARFEIYASHQSSNPSNATNGLYYRTGWSTDKKQWTRFLDSNNSSVSKNGETLTVKINGTSYSLTNTNTTYSAGSGLYLSGTQFSIASNVLVQGSIIDTHHEGNRTIVLNASGNQLFALYDRGGTCMAYEVEQNTDLTQQTLTATGTTVAKLDAKIFDDYGGYNYTVYTGDKFAVYDISTPDRFWATSTFWWSFGAYAWKPAKMRVLVGVYNSDGFTYEQKYSSDSCPAFGKIDVTKAGWNRLRIVVSKYARISTFGASYYDSKGLSTTYMNRCVDDAVYRNISPAKDNTWSLGASNLRWKEVRAVNLYGALTGDFNGNGSGHRIGYRHLDAGPNSSWSDSRLYIGYNGADSNEYATKSIGFYRSTGAGDRTLWAEINANGMYALTRFGVNGQNTNYNLYVNGSINGTSIYLNGTALSTASTHAHEDYVTAIGTSGNTLTWSKGGIAQTAITVPYATNSHTVDGYHASSFVIDAGGNFGSSKKISEIECKRVFSGLNMADAPVTGWVSGLVLGANWNNAHFQHYLVESVNGHWYTTNSYSDGSMKNWNQFAYITDNVASATKLQTPRSIWGQSFDGTGNVNGTITLNCADWDNDYGIHINEGGSTSYGFDILYGSGDKFKISTRSGSTTATEVLTIARGSTVVDFKGTPTVNGTSVSLSGHTHSYLPLSGGTLTGELYINKSSQPLLMLQIDGVNKAQYGYHDNYGILLHNYQSNSGIGINNNGNVVIGDVTTTPSYKLYVQGSCAVEERLILNNAMNYPLTLRRYGNDGEKLEISVLDVVAKFNASDSDGYCSFSFCSNGTEFVRFYGYNKCVGIGTSSPSYKLHVSGDCAASNFYTTSDRNKKQNISSFSEHIRKFQLKSTEKWHYGVIALEVPEMFREGLEGNMTVNYNSVLSYYVGSLENSVASLKDAKQLLENKIKELENRIKLLEDGKNS